MPTLPVARLDIEDVNLVVVFVDSLGPGKISVSDRRTLYDSLERRCAGQGWSGCLVTVWQDSFGRTRFLARPEQHPFFQAVSYAQLQAQVNDSLAVPETIGSPE